MQFLALLLLAVLSISLPIDAAPLRQKHHSGCRGSRCRGKGGNGGAGSAAGGAGSPPPNVGDGVVNAPSADVGDVATGGSSTGLAINPNLVPQFGVVRGTDADAVQVGSCTGSTGTKTVLIPCACPPDRDAFLQKLSSAVAAGNSEGVPISFNNDASDLSPEAERSRATAAIIVLQNFNGRKGSGCPGAAAPNFLLQQQTGVRSDRVFVGA